VHRVRVQLSGPSHIELLDTEKSYSSIGWNSVKNASFSIVPKQVGTFTLDATLYDSEPSHTFPIEIRVE